ncbi:ABC-three component system protein [Streptomyces sp. NPDC047009]|uniref:ABC-three component system protein n=1 Tax=Streptomyces sp. NPDC047009 TaxID=3154496 RepID=UPI0034082187
MHQLRWINLGPSEPEKAMMDYYRAYNQAVAWVDNDLIALDELRRYQDDLVDEVGAALRPHGQGASRRGDR